LEQQKDIRVNVTVMMSAKQCFFSEMGGANGVSIFGGRVNNMEYNSCVEIIRLKKLLDQFDIPAQIIVGSTR